VTFSVFLSQAWEDSYLHYFPFLVKLSVPCCQEASWRGKGLFSVHFHTAVHHQRKSGLELRQGRKQELMQRPWRDVTYWLASPGLLSLLSYRTKTTSPEMVPPTRGPPHLITNWENALQLDLMEEFPQLKLLSLKDKLQPVSSWQKTSQYTDLEWTPSLGQCLILDSFLPFFLIPYPHYREPPSLGSLWGPREKGLTVLCHSNQIPSLSQARWQALLHSFEAGERVLSGVRRWHKDSLWGWAIVLGPWCGKVIKIQHTVLWLSWLDEIFVFLPLSVFWSLRLPYIERMGHQGNLVMGSCLTRGS
jgi:hypothetical protein